MLGLFEDFRRRLAFGVAQDPVAVVQVAVQFHEPDGDQPVEPCVGHRLHRLREAMPLDAVFELLPLLGDGTRMLPPADHRHVALSPRPARSCWPSARRRQHDPSSPG